MNLKNTLLALTAVVGLSSTAHAQLQVTFTGSTAFRSIVLDRIPSLYDGGAPAAKYTSDPNKIIYSYSGTMSNQLASLGTTPVLVRCYFSGSGAGMTAVKNGTLLPCLNVDGTTVTNIAADAAFSDVYPASASPSIASTAFASNSILGVVGFVFAKNNALTGITNITREQAVLLMTASGDGGMPASFLGGTGAGAANPVYLIGRDSGSGSRITVEKDLGFVGSPNLWATNGDHATYSLIAGFSSGAAVITSVAGGAQSIGYVGLADFNTITDGSVSSLSYQGVPYSHAAVASGSYELWGYEHMVIRTGVTPSSNQGTVIGSLYKAITDTNYQSTSIYSNNYVRLQDMQVSRGADGGAISSKNF